jgi:hypothetical protein
MCWGSLNLGPWEITFRRLSCWMIFRSPVITCRLLTKESMLLTSATFLIGKRSWKKFHHILKINLFPSEFRTMRNHLSETHVEWYSDHQWLHVQMGCIEKESGSSHKSEREVDQDPELESLSDWVRTIRSLVQGRIHKLKNCVNSRPKSIFKDQEAVTCLSSLHDKYVIVPADKASNNIVFVCKSYYFECLIKELGNV